VFSSDKAEGTSKKSCYFLRSVKIDKTSELYNNHVFVCVNRLTRASKTVALAPVPKIQHEYLCFTCKSRGEDKFYGRAHDLHAHCIAKHGLVPVDAIHSQPHSSDRTDLIVATKEQIKKNGDGSHRTKKKTTGAKASQDDSESHETSGMFHCVGDEKATIDGTSVPTKAALKATPEAAEVRAPPDDLPKGLDRHIMMLIALGRELERQQAQKLPKAAPAIKEEIKIKKTVEKGRVTTSLSAPPVSTPAHLNLRVTVRTMDAATTGASVNVKGKVVDLTKSLRPKTTDMDVERNSSEEEEFGETSSFFSQSASAVQVKFPSEMSVSDVTGGSPTPLMRKQVPAGKVPGKVPVVFAPPVTDPAITVKTAALKVIIDENAEQARIGRRKERKWS